VSRASCGPLGFIRALCISAHILQPNRFLKNINTPKTTHFVSKMETITPAGAVDRAATPHHDVPIHDDPRPHHVAIHHGARIATYRSIAPIHCHDPRCRSRR
jgi:hypothetical protein